MRKGTFGWFLALALPLCGCGPELFPPGQDPLTALLDLTNGANGDPAQVTAPAAPATGNPVTSPLVRPTEISGSVSGTGVYELFDLGAASPGDQWVVSQPNQLAGAGSFIVVLFDQDYDLLMRTRIGSHVPLTHVTRADTSNVYVGVMPLSGYGGGDFQFEARRTAGVPVPTARKQVVYLDFRAGAGVAINTRGPLSFAAFDADMLGAPYAGETQVVKQAIIDTVSEDYAPYQVEVLNSDQGPPPADVPYADIHFGGADDSLLGLADNVDAYNADAGQAAIIYVNSFAPYAGMKLTPEEMGVMVGNVASHELGHLLGLFHAKDPHEVMDSTGTAWELASAQTFGRAALEGTVFAMGMQNAPRLLEQTLGSNPDAPPTPKPLSAAKRSQRSAIRAFVQEEIGHRCGLCINPDQ